MVKYNEIKIKYSSAPMPPNGISLDRIYSILRKDDNLYITDGNVEIQLSEELIKMLFIIVNSKLSWKDIDFSDEVTKVSKIKNNINEE